MFFITPHQSQGKRASEYDRLQLGAARARLTFGAGVSNIHL